LVAGVFVYLLTVFQPVRADFWRSIEGLVSGKIEYTISVTDSRGLPIEGATIWLLGDDESRQDLKLDDLRRLVRRYSADADFVFTDSLEAGLLVLRTDRAGVARLVFDERDIGQLKSITSHFAAIKRGYEPTVRTDVAEAHSNRKMMLALERIDGPAQSPLLDEFDRLRSLAEKQLEHGANEQAAVELSKVSARLRAIATSLEAQGHFDDAAAIYYNLANLPSVDMVRNSSGKLVVKGYSRGFDEQSPIRVADRARAWQLNKTHPWLDFERMRADYMARGLMVFAGNRNSEVRRSYIEQTERFIREHGERMWPDVYTQLWRVYNAEGDFDGGCEALRRFHSFEPSMFDAASWQQLTGMYAADVKLHGGGVRSCEIERSPPNPAQH